jgi:alkylation response protein AidB-like acyl-CoA dehydrogenase
VVNWRERVERPHHPLNPRHHAHQQPAGAVVADAAAARLLRRNAALLAAAFQVGLGTAALELGTRYATEREQFGRPIGAFQAVKHLLADVAVGLETARAAVDAAAVTADESDDLDAVARAVVAARIVASRAAAAAASACIQVHGGMGYTWDLDAHLYLKRVLVLDQTPGTVDEAVDQLVAALR